MEHEAGVRLHAVDEGEDLRRLLGADAQRKAVFPRQLPQQRLQQVEIQTVGTGHGEGHGKGLGGKTGSLRVQGGPALRQRDKLHALRRQLDAAHALAPLDQRDAQLLLQLPQPRADGGLGDIQLLCGQRDALIPHNAQKCLDIGDVHAVFTSRHGMLKIL